MELYVLLELFSLVNFVVIRGKKLGMEVGGYFSRFRWLAVMIMMIMIIMMMTLIMIMIFL